MTVTAPGAPRTAQAAEIGEYIPSGMAAAQPQDAVNEPFTRRPAKRPKREKDIIEYAAMMRRLIRAYGRRLELEDAERLGVLMSLQDELAETINHVARKLHEDGFSWGEIGRQLGITRQAAYQRWGKRQDDYEPCLICGTPFAGPGPLCPDCKAGA